VQTWQLEPTPPPGLISADAVCLLFGTPSDTTPAKRMLGFLERLVPIDYLSLVEYLPNRRERMATPELVEGHSRAGVINVTPDCFAHYRRFFWRQDDATRVAHEVGQRQLEGVSAMHVQADEIRFASWRQEIYERAHLAGRLSFLYSPVPHRTFSVNLYRDRSHGDFRPAEIESLLGVASLLRQAHSLNLCSSPLVRQASHQAQRIDLAEAALQRKVPQLSRREVAVCARIACGMSADGIAVDLGIGPATVATLRKRAYAKMSEHGMVAGRLQLASLVH